MTRYIDLSYPIRNHWRWRYQKTLDRDYLLGGPLREEVLYTPVHCFTHIDPPGHAVPGGAMIDEIPLETLIGRAKILDFSDWEESAEIAAGDLDERGADVKEGDIVVIKTCHGTRYTLEDRDFWFRAPYMGESAGNWMVERSVRAAGFDFPQDYVLRDFFSGRIPTIEEMHMHRILLGNGILQIEYLTNLDKITEKEVMLYAIPLRLQGVAGSPARVFAEIEE